MRLLDDKRCFKKSFILVINCDDIFFLVSFLALGTAIRKGEIALDTAFSKYVTANRDAGLLMVVIVVSEANNTCGCRVRTRTFFNFISDKLSPITDTFRTSIDFVQGIKLNKWEIDIDYKLLLQQNLRFDTAR